MDDKVKQKIDTFDEYVLGGEREVPESLRDRYVSLDVSARATNKQKREKKGNTAKRFLIPAICGAAAVAICIALPLALKKPANNKEELTFATPPDSAETPPIEVPDPSGPTSPGQNLPGYTTDFTELEFCEISPALFASYGLAHPTSGVTAQKHTMFYSADNGACAYIKSEYTLSGGELEVITIVDAGFDYIDAFMFDEADVRASADGFDFYYKVYSKLRYSLARFELKGRDYYIRYYSPVPEDIVNIICDM